VLCNFAAFAMASNTLSLSLNVLALCLVISSRGDEHLIIIISIPCSLYVWKVEVAVEQLDRKEGIDGEVVVERLREKLRKTRENQG
jgi:hypothetical protein